ncbi:hypothetical protein E2C01_027353 [Portunus trituberculatus]|uniref:Uncharacterized protein n=1 Tax=Portunus trituberculatus TaxID=210409 RepID=A0A5B7ELQ4_PORTR|nr:hypothetical protein [Portunus trituberculatus]
MGGNIDQVVYLMTAGDFLRHTTTSTITATTPLYKPRRLSFTTIHTPASCTNMACKHRALCSAGWYSQDAVHYCRALVSTAAASFSNNAIR